MKIAAKTLVLAARLALGLLVPISMVCAQAPKVGPNVNMVSGTRFPEGDPFLTKQNEPSIAVSSRNPRHLLAASNDFRQVPVVDAELEDGGDAWNTLYKSVDGGTSWRSVVLGGCPLNIAGCNDVTGLTADLKALYVNHTPSTPTFSADPTVRPGPHGTFFYSFIAGHRETSVDGVVAVQRFVDKNNDIQRDTDVREQTDGRKILFHADDPILPDRMNVLDRGTLKKFIDKPWNAVDIGGRPWNTGTCELLSWTKSGSAAAAAAGVGDSSETVPAFSVYVAYSIFTGLPTATNRHPKIWIASSSDCGTTFSAPVMLSREVHASQGASMAVDPLSGTIYVVWRSFGTEDDEPSESEADRIYMNKSTDGGRTWLYEPVVVATLIPYDQAATGNSFRTLAFPSVAVSVDPVGISRVHVAFTSRSANVGKTAPYACQSTNPKDCDARVRIATSKNGGTTWSTAVPVDPIPATPTNPNGRGHQVQPTLTFAAGKLAVSWLDQRLDQTEEVLVCPAGATCTQVTDLVRSREVMGNLDPSCAIDSVANPTSPLSALPQTAKDLLGPTPGACYEYRPGRPASVWTTYLTDGSPGLVRRHTIDVFAALADPADTPAFASSRVSQYLFGSTRQDSKGNFTIRQKELFAPNLPLFAIGTAAFIGDYIDIAGQSIVATGDASQRYKFNIGPNACTSAGCTKSTTAGTSPIFHVAFTDNRDVIPPASGDWSQPTCLASEFTADPTNPTNSFGACATPGFSGNRNQNVRSAIITTDSVAYAYSNSKLLSASAPRGFVISVENLGDELAGKSYRMSISPPAGVTASFDKTSFGSTTGTTPPPPLTTVDILVQPRSSATRSLWVNSTTSNARLVVQITSPPGCSGAGCYVTEVALNPDPGASQSLVGNGDGTNIDLSNNDMGSVVLSNAVLTNNVLSNDVPNTAALTDVALSNNALTNAVLSNVVLSNAVLSNLQVENLNPANVALSNEDLTNNVLTNAALSNVVLTNSVLSNLALSNNVLSNAVLSNNALSNAVLSNNALSNIALTNLDPANLALSNAVLSNNALSNVALSNNALSNVVLTNAALTNAALSNVVLSNVALSNNALSNNALSNVALSNNVLSNSVLPDALRTVEAANSDLGKNDFTSADLGASQFADGTFTIRNRGNTDTTLAVKLLLRDATNCNPTTQLCTLPDGVKLQLVMRKIGLVPTAIPPTDAATQTGRALRIGLAQFNAQVSNVGTPEVVSPDAPDLGSFLPSKTDAATLPLGPGERAYVTLRAISTAPFNPADPNPATNPFEFLRWGAKFVVADAALATRTTIPLIIKTLSLPTATALQTASFTIRTAGGFGNVTATSLVCADQFGTPVSSPCPPSLNLTFPADGSRDGTLTFRPAVKGTFYVLITVADESLPAQNDRQLLKVVVNGATQVLTPSLDSLPGSSIEYGKTVLLNPIGSSGAAVQFISNSPAVCTVIPAAAAGTFVLTPLALGPCELQASVDGNEVYSSLSVIKTVIVVKGSQTISFDPLVAKTFGDAQFAIAATATSGLPVTFASTTAGVCTVVSSTTNNVTTWQVALVTVGTCTIAANQAGNDNYSAASQVTQSFVVGKGAQTIIFGAAPTVVVGGTGTVSATGGLSGSAVAYSSTTAGVCTISGTAVTGVAAGTCVIAANQAGNDNYNAASQVTQSFVVGKGAQTITFGAAPTTVFVGGTGAVSATGGLSGNAVTFSSTTAGVCTISGTTVTGVTAGTCTIAASQAGSANYNAAPQVTQSFAVTKASQTISWVQPLPNVVYSRSPQKTVMLNASASSGLPVSFTSTTPAVCTVSGNIATIVGAGTCTITAGQAGNSSYNAAPTVTRFFKVAKSYQKVSCDDIPNRTLSSSTYTVNATASSGLGVSLSSLTKLVCTVSGGTVKLLRTGICTIVADQPGDTNFDAAPSVWKGFIVTP